MSWGPPPGPGGWGMGMPPQDTSFQGPPRGPNGWITTPMGAWGGLPGGGFPRGPGGPGGPRGPGPGAGWGFPQGFPPHSKFRHEDQKDPRKLFVGGINRDLTPDDFRKHFEKYGKIVDIVLMKDPNDGSRNRGFGFVTFERLEDTDGVLDKPQLFIAGRSVDVKRAVPRAEHQEQVKAQQRENKLWVGNIPADVDTPELTRYFEKYGPVDDCIVMVDVNTGEPRGFGFVSFGRSRHTDYVLSKNDHEIRGYRLKVMRASRNEDYREQQRSQEHRRERDKGLPDTDPSMYQIHPYYVKPYSYWQNHPAISNPAAVDDEAAKAAKEQERRSRERKERKRTSKRRRFGAAPKKKRSAPDSQDDSSDSRGRLRSPSPSPPKKSKTVKVESKKKKKKKKKRSRSKSRSESHEIVDIDSQD